MTPSEFQDLLNAHGADPSAWPEALRGRAERLLAADPAARARLAEAQRLDRLIARHMSAPAPSLDAAAGRVLRVLAGELPRQRGWRGHRFALSWPTWLLRFDFAPAPLRIAVLVGVAALGVALGLLGPDVGSAESRLAVASARSEISLAAVFEPEPLTGVRP
jgi:anti-sigma factor RsiW